MVKNKTTPFMGVSGDCGVVTQNGLRKASDVRVGDKILTSENTYDRVSSIISTGEKKQSVIKMTVPLIEEPFSSFVYMSKNTNIVGILGQKSRIEDISAVDFTKNDFVYLPSEVTQRSPTLHHKLRGDSIIQTDNGVCVPISGVIQTMKTVNLFSFETESNSFVAGGVTVSTDF